MAPVSLTCGDGLRVEWGTADLVFIDNFLMTDVEVVVDLIHNANTDAPHQLICVEPIGVNNEVYHCGEKLVVPEEARSVTWTSTPVRLKTCYLYKRKVKVNDP